MPTAPCPSTAPPLTLSAAELDALRAVLARGCGAMAGTGASTAADASAGVLRALAARLDRADAIACLALDAADAGGWGDEDAAFALPLDARERELLACAIDAWMVDCNERRGEPGAAERARIRWRAGGIALRL